MKSWQIFSYALKGLPRKTINNIYRHSLAGQGNNKAADKETLSRSFYYWAANPAHAQSIPNPIDRLKMLLEELYLAGHETVARAAVDIMAEPLGGSFAPWPDVLSDKHSVDGELVDVMTAMGTLATACRNFLEDNILDPDERHQIMDLIRKVKIELDQVLAAAEEHERDF